MNNFLQFGTNVMKSHRQPEWTLRVEWEDRMLYAWVDLHVSVCGQQHPKCERAIRLMYPPFFFKLRFIQTHTQKSNGVRSGDSIHHGNRSEL